jgi:hypothetical protein
VCTWPDTGKNLHSLALNGTVRMLERVFGSSKWPFVRRASYTKESTL